jgi:hypothetical protein
VAVGDVFGARIFDVEGMDNWGKPYMYSHRLVALNYRMYDGLSMDLPFSRIERSWLRVPVSGEYEIIGNKLNRDTIKVDGTTVYENMTLPWEVKSSKIFISKDRPVKLEVFHLHQAAPVYERASTIYIKGPGMEDFEMMPVFWSYPID